MTAWKQLPSHHHKRSPEEIMWLQRLSSKSPCPKGALPLQLPRPLPHYHYHETRAFPLSVLSGSDIVIEMRRQKTKVKERVLIHPRRVEAKSKKRKVYSCVNARVCFPFCKILNACVLNACLKMRENEVLCTCMRVCVYVCVCLCELRF